MHENQGVKRLRDQIKSIHLYDQNIKEQKHAIHEFNPDLEVKHDELIIARDYYNSTIQFYANFIIFMAGNSNFVFFPHIVFKHGLLALMLPIILIYSTMVLPYYVIQIYIGQFLSRSGLYGYSYVRAFRGIGCSCLFFSSIVAIIYVSEANVLLYYVIHSIKDNMPWTKCTISGCTNLTSCNKINKFLFKNISLSTTIYYKTHNFNNTPVNNNYDLDEHLITYNASIWIFVFLVLLTHLKGISFISMISILLITILCICLLINLIFMPYSYMGIQTYFAFHLDTLWQIDKIPNYFLFLLITNPLGCSTIITLASFNQFKYNFKNDSFIFIIIDITLSLLFSFITCAITGAITGYCKMKINNFKDAELNTVYELTLFGLSDNKVATLMYLTVILISYISSTIIEIFHIIISISDHFVSIHYNSKKCIALTAIICGIHFSIGILFCSNWKNILISILDFISVFIGFILFVISIFTLFYIYKLKNMKLDIKMMIKTRQLSVVLNILYCLFPFSCIIISIFLLPKLINDLNHNQITELIIFSIIGIVLSPFIFIFIKEFIYFIIAWHKKRSKYDILQSSIFWGPFYRRYWLDDRRFERRLAHYRADMDFIRMFPESEDFGELLTEIVLKHQHKIKLKE